MKPYAPHWDLKGRPGSRVLRWRERLQQKTPPRCPPLKQPLLVHQRMTPGESMSNITTLQPEITQQELDALRESIRTVLEKDGAYSQARVAKESDVSTSTLSQWMGGTYPGSHQAIAKKLRAWHRSYEERNKDGGLPQPPAWAETPTSARIMSGLRYAQMAQDLVLILGGAGVGKTKTIEKYQSMQPNVWSVELTPATGGEITAMEEIVIALGVRDYARTSGHLFRTILSKVRHTNGLLILDEAQHLTVKALDQVRAILDQGGIGLVLSGNERVYTQMTGGTRAPFLDRLYSRVGQKIILRKATAKDADAIIDAWGFEDARCRDALRAIANKPGALRQLNKVLRLAAAYAKAQNHKLSCDDIHVAARELGVYE
ncbi:AAA family ATPase [Pseudoxanthomonas mexicana]|uniref:AAA family ATPase n=1 Tax=Pseudoxanthomonas mexicana TaxID=128785 RepID=UPI00398B13F3